MSSSGFSIVDWVIFAVLILFWSGGNLLCLHWRKTEDDRRVPNGGPEDADTSGRSLHPRLVPDSGVDTGSAGGDVHQRDPVLSVVVRTARCCVFGHHFIRSAVLSIKTYELFRGINSHIDPYSINSIISCEY